MLQSSGGSDSEPAQPFHTQAWLDHARHVIAEGAQPFDFYDTDPRQDILGFEKPPELVPLWHPPQWDAIVLPTDILAHRVPFFENQRDVWALRDRNTGGVWQAPTSDETTQPHPLLLPSLPACVQWVELLSGQICDLWAEGISPGERRMFGPVLTTFKPRTRQYVSHPRIRPPDS